MTKLVTFVLIGLILCSCGRQRDVQLFGGYKLCPLENVPKDNYFIVNSDNETVVAPDVLQAWHSGSFVWGYVRPTNDPSFFPVREGYFYIRIATGKFIDGLSDAELRAIIPNLDDRNVFTRER